MPYYPSLPIQNTYRVTVDQFQGLDRNARTVEGTFTDMKNMTGDKYPVLSVRNQRSIYGQATSPQGILAKDALVYVDGESLIYNGTAVKGVTLSVLPGDVPKTLLSMGSYILVWPDKIWVNTLDLSHGSMEQENTSSSLTYTLCKNDGTIYDTPTVSATPPSSPNNGDLWIDSSGEVHALMQYDSMSSQWINIATTYIRIDATNIGAGLNRHDGVDLSGCAYTGDATLESQIAALNGTVIVYDCDTNYIVVVGILDQAVTQSSGEVTVKRSVPEMDYVIEAENRIWGCRYGHANKNSGPTVNEIRCSALGDFKNWNQFLGLSTDSWVGSQGTDGVWTGAVTYMGHPLFFKENVLHKVYISSQGAHQVVTTACRGVQKGSDKSLVVVDELLYYKARIGVMRYDGSLPVCISDALGSDMYYNAVAGGFGSKYYISMKNASNVWGLYVFNAQTGFWHKEDSHHSLGFARIDDSLLSIDAATNASSMHDIVDMNGRGLSKESAFDWFVTTGIIGFDYADQKRLYRYNIRMDLPTNSTCTVWVMYDSSNTWIQVASGTGRGLGNLTIPVIPRRCDHMQIKIEGNGAASIYSFSKILEMSGDKQ